MAASPVWHFFAYFHSDADGERDEHRNVAEWQIGDVVRWAHLRGFDAIHLSRTDRTADFRLSEVQLSDPGVGRGVAA